MYGSYNTIDGLEHGSGSKRGCVFHSHMGHILCIAYVLLLTALDKSLLNDHILGIAQHHIPPYSLLFKNKKNFTLWEATLFYLGEPHSNAVM